MVVKRLPSYTAGLVYVSTVGQAHLATEWVMVIVLTGNKDCLSLGNHIISCE